jgi:hypothetical protein
MTINLYSNDIFISQTTKTLDLQKLAQSLHPVITKYELLRIGKNSDGGYLIPNDLEDIAACFSPGVEQNSSFELDLQSKTGIPSHLADLSVDGPPSNFTPKSFIKKFLGPINTDTHITLAKWIEDQQEHLHDQDLLLQMDIEGDEYTTILATSDEVLNKFRIIVLELHHIESWANPYVFSIVEVFFKKLLNNFHIVHNHPNNHGKLLNLNGFVVPQFMEMTFLRKDRSPIEGYSNEFPHALDRPCYAGHPEIALPSNWHA